MLIYFLLLFILFSGILVFYSLSPYYAALGLVSAALSGCIILGIIGLPFLALIFLLVYLGGMLVVFVYSSALSTDRFPEVSNLAEVFLLTIIISFWFFFVYSNNINGPVNNINILLSNDIIGLSILFNNGGYYLLVGGLALLVALIVVLIISSNNMNLSLRHI
uniref:NADH-ubiquinone oxidoreductase chain 6 n=1 Tax=Peniagone sp. YYH-2013 TaxID=1430316 RepID=W5W4Z7_9ECHN|nr:NADH dehydrogenase subunit 6 [Peniagone sp. YYH-2013]